MKKPFHSIILLCFLFLFSFVLFQTQAQQYSDYIGAGHHLDVTVTSSSNQGSATGFNTISGVGMMPDLKSASRFLAHSTLGADYETIEAVSQQGLSAWLEAQFNEPMFPMLTHLDDTLEPMAYQGHLNEGLPADEFGTWHFFRLIWWESVMTGNDLLRDRMALALSEIFVVSENSDLRDYAEGQVSYYEMLYQNAFGNFRDILYDVTMHPAMGSYLSHFNNPKANPTLNTFPDENYAREVMQLFSIGLYELNIDGSRKTDATGRYIPTYENDDIREFAKIFTGLSASAWSRYALEEMAETGQNWGPIGFDACLWCTDMTLPMAMYDSEHEPGAKYLLNGQVVPAGQTGMQDINDAIDNLFNHPNVGPFIANLLIQRLVKSNPTPEYIARVATTFNDNGSGVRGDMKSLIRAILMDPEARDCSWTAIADHGMLKEPIVRYTHITRAFNASNAFGRFYNFAWFFTEEQQQQPLSSPSVFNFFSPEYQPLGPISDLDLVAPEFQIFNSATSLTYVNLAQAWIMWDWVFDDYTEWYPDPSSLPADPYTVLNFDDEEAFITSQANISAEIDALLDHLDIIMTHGNLSETTKQTIKTALLQLGADSWAVPRFAAFFVAISPDYAIMK